MGENQEHSKQASGFGMKRTWWKNGRSRSFWFRLSLAISSEPLWEQSAFLKQWIGWACKAAQWRCPQKLVLSRQGGPHPTGERPKEEEVTENLPAPMAQRTGNLSLAGLLSLCQACSSLSELASTSRQHAEDSYEDHVSNWQELWKLYKHILSCPTVEILGICRCAQGHTFAGVAWRPTSSRTGVSIMVVQDEST